MPLTTPFEETHCPTPSKEIGESQVFLVSLLTKTQKREYLALAGLWLAALFSLWHWWLQPEHIISVLGFILSSIVLAWVTLLPLYFILIFFRSRVPSQAVTVPRGLRAAMVVTKVPSEPFCLVRRTLEAMLQQTYPHDTWLADEDPSEETIEWCRQHGVSISTRKNCGAYHQPVWPRRARCKEGNLAYFYDHYGYTKYDYVVQLDADHVPSKHYLEEMLRPFADPSVGYVSAPSICDQNANDSWSARGRLYVEGALHGALQAGYNGGLAPLCIGSHYAVRTIALKQIGGLGPELAEDHSTTLMMNAHGWRGVHAVNAIARGDGPRTFSDMIIQEFQWSRSLMSILLKYTPRYYSKLPFKLKFQFIFSQIWYSSFSIIMLLMLSLPLFAIIHDEPLVNVPYIYFLLYSLPVTFALVLIAWRLRRFGYFRPCEVKVFSWEGILFLFARWPWTLLGTLAAFYDHLTGKISNFRVTPKGLGPAITLPSRVIAPYAIISIVSGLAVTLIETREASGYYIFALINCAIYTSLLLVTVTADRGSTIGFWNSFWLAGAIIIPLLGIGRIPDGLQSLIWTGPVNSRLASSVLAESVGHQTQQPMRTITIGAYDPANLLDEMPELSIDHVFLQWNSFNKATLDHVSERAKSQRKTVMVTIEPFTRAQNWRDGRESLFSEIVSGSYDGVIREICESLAALGPRVLIRWGHEMDDPDDRYPWAKSDPAGYINAYRHFVKECRRKNSHGKYVWSPKAKGNVANYYPGDGYVDFVGYSAYFLEAWDLENPQQASAEASVVQSRYRRVAGFGKPVIIAELGVSGSSDYVRSSLRGLSQQIRVGALPLLRAVVYFNDREPHTWGAFGSPDWRVSRDMLRMLAEEPTSGDYQ